VEEVEEVEEVKVEKWSSREVRLDTSFASDE
jgi:hypothetical protein